MSADWCWVEAPEADDALLDPHRSRLFAVFIGAERGLTEAAETLRRAVTMDATRPKWFAYLVD